MWWHNHYLIGTVWTAQEEKLICFKGKDCKEDILCHWVNFHCSKCPKCWTNHVAIWSHWICSINTLPCQFPRWCRDRARPRVPSLETRGALSDLRGGIPLVEQPGHNTLELFCCPNGACMDHSWSSLVEGDEGTNYFGYCPWCTDYIVLYFHKHNSLPLGQIRACTSFY